MVVVAVVVVVFVVSVVVFVVFVVAVCLFDDGFLLLEIWGLSLLANDNAGDDEEKVRDENEDEFFWKLLDRRVSKGELEWVVVSTACLLTEDGDVVGEPDDDDEEEEEELTIELNVGNVKVFDEVDVNVDVLILWKWLFDEVIVILLPVECCIVWFVLVVVDETLTTEEFINIDEWWIIDAKCDVVGDADDDDDEEELMIELNVDDVDVDGENNDEFAVVVVVVVDQVFDEVDVDADVVMLWTVLVDEIIIILLLVYCSIVWFGRVDKWLVVNDLELVDETRTTEEFIVVDDVNAAIFDVGDVEFAADCIDLKELVETTSVAFGEEDVEAMLGEKSRLVLGWVEKWLDADANSFEADVTNDVVESVEDDAFVVVVVDETFEELINIDERWIDAKCDVNGDAAAAANDDDEEELTIENIDEFAVIVRVVVFVVAEDVDVDFVVVVVVVEKLVDEDAFIGIILLLEKAANVVDVCVVEETLKEEVFIKVDDDQADDTVFVGAVSSFLCLSRYLLTICVQSAS